MGDIEGDARRLDWGSYSIYLWGPKGFPHSCFWEQVSIPCSYIGF